MSGVDTVVSVVGSGSAPAMLAPRGLLAGNGVAHRRLDTDTGRTAEREVRRRSKVGRRT